MNYISTVCYYVLVYGERHGPIVAKRGLCQGDPLSLYLFLLCSEGLARLLKQTIRNKLIHGISLSRQGHRISRLFFFADDSFLFCNSSMIECQNLCEILRVYESVHLRILGRR